MKDSNIGDVGIQLVECLESSPNIMGKLCKVMLSAPAFRSIGSGEQFELPLPATRLSIGSLGKRFKVRVTKADGIRVCSHSKLTRGCMWCGVLAWALLQITVINVNYGAMRERTLGKMAADAGEKLSGAQEEIFGNLLEQAVEFVQVNPGTLPGRDWEKYLKGKCFSYGGEIVSVAQPLSWEQVEASLPPPGACARVPALDIADGAVRRFFGKRRSVEGEGSSVARETTARANP